MVCATSFNYIFPLETAVRILCNNQMEGRADFYPKLASHLSRYQIFNMVSVAERNGCGGVE